MKRLALIGIALLMAVSGPIIASQETNAVSAAGFDPGRIIDDAIFYDPAGMGSVSEVQTFLNAHVPVCDTWGTGKSGYGNLTNAQYAQQIQGWPGPPYVCLNNYYENPSNGETSFERGGGAFEGGQSAAQIIYDAAQKYKINPKVLLVLLRKESLNLFSDSWPMKSQYRYAMGYACPDSGPNYSAACVDSKAGFYNQVTLAAWQLRTYYTNMGSYNFAPGRWNTIQYNPQPSCGTKNVYIQNYATASLYIYTPYTPNDAALNAYPGTAPCGAYGNRNFWFFWQEWFGSTMTNGNFVRSVDSATVYLIGNRNKYPVSDASLLGAASNLGNVGFVSQAYLDTIPTGPLLGRTIQSPDGTIYYYDSSIKLPFTSCSLVADYGGACGGAAELSQAQIDKFITGPLMTNGMQTTSGRTYFITGGTKREVLDRQSLTSVGINIGFNTLTDDSLSHLSLGQPYIREEVIIQSRQDTNKRLIKAGGLYNIDQTQFTNAAYSSLTTSQLDSQSIAKLNPAAATINDSFKDESGTMYVLAQNGKKKVIDANLFGGNPVVVPSTLVAKMVGTGDLTNPALMRTSDNATVYAMVGGEKRPLIAMEDLKSITGQDNPYIAWTTGNLLNGTPTGNIIVGAGRLVKTPSNGTVYMTDGYNKLVPMGTFEPATDMGVSMSIRTISDAILTKYTVDSTILSSYITCNGVSYVAISGKIYPITISGKIPRILQSQTCNVLSVEPTLPEFILSNGTIYQLKQGKLHPISSWQTYQSLSASGGKTLGVTYSTLTLFPIGNTL